MKKRVLLLIFTILLFALVVYLQPSTEVYRLKGKLDNSIMRNIEIKRIVDSNPIWWAKIKEASFIEGKQLALLKEITLYWPERGLYLNAQNGTYDISRGRVKLDRAIKGYTENMVIETDGLKYNPQKRLLYTNEGITIRGKGFTITGKEASIKDGKKLEIKGNVKSVFK
ncbi:MAG: LPS export ABC transporter periplasmic protein LptC [Nitrospirae bacterium]|nr:LPS export ABC transporter periplasmic protein LptC [Nitrospirota bacterium]